MRKTEIKKRKYGFLSVLFLVACLLLVLPSERSLASEYPVITSEEDFYDKLSEQIYGHKEVQRYQISGRNLIDKVMSFTFAQYKFHYDSATPLASGCYLGYYVKHISLSYSRGILKVTVSYPYTAEEMSAHLAETKRLARELAGESDFETVKNVHDYLIRQFEYDQREENKNHTDIEGFRDGVMVCSGYGLAAYFLLSENGIPVRIITGYGGGDNPKESNHLWNMVKVDGFWYNMDVTWDDLGGDRIGYEYFLKNDAEFPGHTRLDFYAGSYFSNLVARHSYKLPGALVGPGLLRFLILLTACAGFALLCVIIKKKGAGAR